MKLYAHKTASDYWLYEAVIPDEGVWVFHESGSLLFVTSNLNYQPKGKRIDITEISRPDIVEKLKGLTNRK